MKYKPGSFSKNFAWHGTGLAKLHLAIRSGFGGKLEAVEREQFRRRCGILEKDLQLIPLNFFLFNWSGSAPITIKVDELVFQAIERPHSLTFDRLSVFALHLSSVGDIPSGGTPWLREFVMEHLWENGFWKRAELEIPALDAAFASLIDVKREVREKCRSNYRHILDLAGFLAGREEFLDNREGHWLSPAIILAWDRAILSGALSHQTDARNLTDYIRAAAIHRLLGVDEGFALQYSTQLAPTYLAMGGTERFDEKSKSLAIAPPEIAILGRTEKRSKTLEEIGKQINNAEVARVRRVVQQQLRNDRLSAGLKALYGGQCMFCDARICVSISPEEYYAEAAHIQPLGRPHNGPDRYQNMLVLCPNCHVQFDSGIFTISFVSPTQFIIHAKTKNHPLEGKSVETRGDHCLDPDFCAWHAGHWNSYRK